VFSGVDLTTRIRRAAPCPEAAFAFGHHPAFAFISLSSAAIGTSSRRPIRTTGISPRLTASYA
jgi:hypothetical protein